MSSIHKLKLVAPLCLLAVSIATKAIAAVPIHEVSLDSDHVCAVAGDGTAMCWGDNSWGQLGNGKFLDSYEPVSVTGLTDVKSIAVGKGHSCALLSDTTVKCWGLNNAGQLGDGTNANKLMPTSVGLSDVSALAAKGQTTCALMGTGRVMCWGSNTYGQLGDGHTADQNSPTDVMGLSNAIGLSTNGSSVCALLMGGTIQCWGANGSGQLGTGDTKPQPHPAPVPGLTNATGVTMGALHTCAQFGDGTVSCWGNNRAGQLGDGTKADSLMPRAVSNVSNVVSISAGSGHTCALIDDGAAAIEDGTLRCWGSNASGQLGDGTTMDPPTAMAIKVPGITTAKSIAAGGETTCARLATGAVKCWGFNASGEVGDGTTMDRSFPTDVSGLDGVKVVSISVGDSRDNSDDSHQCAVLSDGTAWCWGQNGFGELGGGFKTPSYSLVPVKIKGLTKSVISVATGVGFTCALLRDTTVWCVGMNNYGQLGDGTGVEKLMPVQVKDLSGVTAKDLSGVTAIAAGVDHACALLLNGQVKCWGSNFIGYIGDGTIGMPRLAPTTPVKLIGSATATAITVALYHSCALIDDGTVQCWGENSVGQLGDGGRTAPYSPLPVSVSGLTNVTAISAGWDHTCAITSVPVHPVQEWLPPNYVACWGGNPNGEIGDGTSGNIRTSPVGVTGLRDIGLSNVTAVLAGPALSCALAVGGAVSCWGVNSWGQLGDGTTNPQTKPMTTVTGVTTAVALGGGGLHACSLSTDQKVSCWGSNNNGPLGDGTRLNRHIPVEVVW